MYKLGYTHAMRWDLWAVTSYQTKRMIKHAAYVHQHNLPARPGWDARIRYALLLDIDSGSLKLNF
jgi:hypothetical protein